MDRIGVAFSSRAQAWPKHFYAFVANQLGYPVSRLAQHQQISKFHLSTATSSKKFTSLTVGVENTKSYRIYFQNSRNEICSPFHDVPLFAADDNDNKKKNNSSSSSLVYNMIVEIPRWSQAKMEISKAEKFNPICQDMKNGKLRFVNNVFPHHGYIWNYGALPQTWEDPDVKCETTGMQGDNDPLDVCEIGSRVAPRGSIVQVKVLGALGLIDEGEADWKILAIDVNDPLAARLHEISDVKRLMPGLLEASRDWFEVYKIPTGKPANKIANNGEFYPAEFARKVIAHDHELWRNLTRVDKKKMSAKGKKISLVHTSELAGAEADRVDSNNARSVFEAEIAKLPNEKPNLNQTEIDTVHYVDRTKLSS